MGRYVSTSRGTVSSLRTRVSGMTVTTGLVIRAFRGKYGLLATNGNKDTTRTVRVSRRTIKEFESGEVSLPTVTLITSNATLAYVNGSCNCSCIFDHRMRKLKGRKSLLILFSADKGTTGLSGTLRTTGTGKVGILSVLKGANNGLTNGTSIRVVVRKASSNHVRRTRRLLVRVLLSTISREFIIG